MGPFRILGLLGKGGMATVYRAQDARLERTIALKVLPPEFLYDGTFARRFEKEARVVARLEHPNIVPIYASGIDEGIPWMSMRLLAGGNLGALLERRRPAAHELVRMLRSIADALDYAHTRGVVHRDIKPTNILLDDSNGVFLGDFGLAHMLEGDRGVTRTGTLIGTPHYMAPEQALGTPADHRSDIYSLGIVAYEMFVGDTPFNGDSPMAVLLKHVNQPLPTPPDGLVPRPMMGVIQRAVAKIPTERWTSAGAFVSALEVAIGVTPARSKPGDRGRADRYSGRSSLRWTGASAAALSAALGLTWWIAREAPSLEQSPLPIPVERTFDGASVVIPVIPPAPASPSPAPAPKPTPARPEPAPSVPQRTPARPEPIPAPPPPTPVVTDQALPSPPPTDIPSPPVPIVQPPVVVADPPDSTALKPAVEPSPAPAVDIRTPPELLRAVNPDYPAAARAAQIEGDVLLQAIVGPDGKVLDVTVLRSVHPLVDEAARNAVLRYEYTPGRRNGAPESATVRITVSFRLR